MITTKKFLESSQAERLQMISELENKVKNASSEGSKNAFEYALKNLREMLTWKKLKTIGDIKMNATLQIRINQNGQYYLHEEQSNGTTIIHNNITFKTRLEASKAALKMISDVNYPLYIIPDQTKVEVLKDEEQGEVNYLNSWLL